MAEKNKKSKKSPFSIYWIYGLIGVVFIGMNLFMNSNSNASIEYVDTFIELSEKSYVQNVEMVNRVRVDFSLNKEGKDFIRKTDDAQYAEMKEMLLKGNRLGGRIKYSVDIFDAGSFSTRINSLNEKLKAAGKNPVQMVPVQEVDYIGQLVSFLLPILILLAIFMFVM